MYKFLEGIDLQGREQELENYLGLLQDRKEAYLSFLQWMSENTQYFTAPASVRYHNSMKYGLLLHSMNVTKNLLLLNKVLANSEYSEESCVIVALSHDMGKAGVPNKGEKQFPYQPNKPSSKQAQYGYVPSSFWSYKPIVPFLEVPHLSVYLLLSHGVELSLEEYQAILIHDGMYCDSNSSYATKESKLASLLQYADNFAGFHQEPFVAVNDDGKGYHLEPQVKA